jgi:anti-sigma28 factor (negative regulator of flagellin synthesis)
MRIGPFFETDPSEITGAGGSVARQPKAICASKIDDSSLPAGNAIGELTMQRAQVPEVRQDHIAALRQAIERGEYHVSDRQIADALYRRAFQKDLPSNERGL